MGVVDESEESDSDAATTSRSKVGRVIQDYELTGLGDELERRWLGVDGERQSLRDLADYFNQQILEAALEQAAEQPIEGEIENHYRLLTADDVTASAQTQAATRLSRLGIDVETLQQDFVSHQAVHTYLTDVRGASFPSDEVTAEAAIQKRAETIQRLRNRLVAVAEHGLGSLKNADHLSLGSFDVLVGITVYCDECGASYDLVDVLDRGGCECRLRSD